MSVIKTIRLSLNGCDADVVCGCCVCSVGDPPEILQPFKDVTVVAPKSATFQCRIDPGDPEAKVRCFRDAKEIYNGPKYQIQIDGESVKLVVLDTELSDASKYKCEAANKIGKAETVAQLIVHSEWDKFLLSAANFIFKTD